MTVDFLQVRPPPHLNVWWFTDSLSHVLECLLSPGGPVRQVGVTITMDDELLNGTNRVVLDGVMTERECEKIMQLATVSSER